MPNAILKELYRLGLSSEDALERFWPRVRDRDDVSVLRCRRSGAFVLSRTDHISTASYEENQGLSYWSEASLESVWNTTREDDTRRAAALALRLPGARWLDFGCGAGGVLHLAGHQASVAVGLEPQAEVRKLLSQRGMTVHRSLDEIQAGDPFDVISLFHVLEHLASPVEVLRALRERLAPTGRLIVEVPHARDALITFYECKSFMDFTFWSEHLLLHTRETLRAFLEEAGYGNVVIKGIQRYPLSNHMYWLARGEPGGHKVWSVLDSGASTGEYERTLAGLDMTDTLWAEASA